MAIRGPDLLVGGLFTTAGNLKAEYFSLWHTGNPKPPRIVQFHPGDPETEIGFTTVPGQTYTVEWERSLRSELWRTVAEDLDGDGTIQRVTHTAEMESPTRFYRVTTRIPPWNE